MSTRPLTDAEKSWVEAHQRSKSRVLLAVSAFIGVLTVLWGLGLFAGTADFVLWAPRISLEGIAGIAGGLLVWLVLGGLTVLIYDAAARNAPGESSPTSAVRVEGRIRQRWVGSSKARRLETTIGGRRVLADHVPGLSELTEDTVVTVWVVEVGHGDRVVVAVEQGWSAV